MAARLSTCLLAALASNHSVVVTPSSPNYNSSLTIYNLNIPILLAAVTYPSTTEEVAGVVKCAAEGNYKVQAKGGGHSYGNYGWGGESGEVVVNLANLNGYSYDNSTGYATVGAGSRLGSVTTSLYNLGKCAVAHGSYPDVGIGGHATIGGLDMVAIWANEAAAAERPAYFYAKSLDVMPNALLLNETIDSMFEHLTATPDDVLTYQLEGQLVSGAMAAVASNAMAFPHCDVLYWIFAYAVTNGTVSKTTIDFLDDFNDVIYSAFPNENFLCICRLRGPSTFEWTRTLLGRQPSAFGINQNDL
ncbi:hypothetical protein TSTA_009190 [Talaromyces stipitatus ATCC 10500]|uniref:FAD-binding PCMH-type domain-containing protein n=1 Tax=Talaromyces stipitatus (strain ATCC 10500 / CBS 375.48 / QM 6759 / NRRL 1006) TaxID=441959 RepID=B8MFS7_TALSN|nr:uncharacterized protein TSTA_009190 [Talaromyces stipitatus ATCC 10500]EED15794.1 hypothetical protein TSTA_009190 [Talaromyces stipitatus ATCC 10500]